jgi:hypothetical protein
VLIGWDEFFRHLDRPGRALPYLGDDCDATMGVFAELADGDGVGCGPGRSASYRPRILPDRHPGKGHIPTGVGASRSGVGSGVSPPKADDVPPPPCGRSPIVSLANRITRGLTRRRWLSLASTVPSLDGYTATVGCSLAPHSRTSRRPPH